jgi:hypothetical protein
MPEANTPILNNDDDALSLLTVFDRLEVGPVTLERKRLVAPYRLMVDGKTEQTELIYTTRRMFSIPVRPNPGTWPT